MNLTRTHDRGNFFCPTCETPQMYRLRARRPFLTLYFIPTVPVGAAETFVQCDCCRSTWDPTVLEMDATSHHQALEEQFREQALRAAILVVLADDTITEVEIRSLQRIGAKLLGQPIDREELGRLCSIAQQNKVEAGNYVLTVSKRWSPDQKKTALQAMFLAATADNGLGKPQMQILAKMCAILGLTETEFESAVEEALQLESV